MLNEQDRREIIENAASEEADIGEMRVAIMRLLVEVSDLTHQLRLYRDDAIITDAGKINEARDP